MINIARFSTPLGTFYTKTDVGIQKIGITIKKRPIYTYERLNQLTLKASIGSIKPQRKYPKVPDRAAKKNLGYLSNSKVPIIIRSSSSFLLSLALAKLSSTSTSFSMKFRMLPPIVLPRVPVDRLSSSKFWLSIFSSNIHLMNAEKTMKNEPKLKNMN